MSDVYIARINRWVEKLFNVKGGPTVVDIEPAVRIVLPIAEYGVESKVQQGWQRFGASINSPAGAGTGSGIQIRNPKADIMAVIEAAYVQQLTAAIRSTLSWSVFIGTSDLATTVTPTPIDNRDNAGSSMVVSTSANAPPGFTFFTSVLTGGAGSSLILFEDQEIVLVGAGFTLRVTDNSNNEAITGSFIWRERAMEQSELT